MVGRGAAWRLYPTPRGIGFGIAWTLFALLAAFLPGAGPLLAASAAVFGGALLWDGVVLARLRAPALRRDVPGRAAIGKSLEIGLELHNRDSATLRFDVFEELPSDLCDDEPEFVARWLRGGAVRREVYSLRPRRRGARPLGVPTVLVRTRFGWLQRRYEFEGDVLHVYPDTSKLLRRETLDPRLVLAQLGVKRARPRGSGLEFETLREYVPGDDLRHIDWRATARRGRTMTRVFRHERDHPVVVAVDTSRLMGAECVGKNLLDHAIEATLALAYTALHHGDRVGVVTFDRSLRGFVTPRRSEQGMGRLLDALHDVQPRLCEPSYTVLARELAARQKQRALVVVLTDVAQATHLGLLAPLAVLARRHRVVLAAIRNPLLDTLGRSAEREDGIALYRRLVVDELRRDREIALAELRQRHVLTLDLAPEEVTGPLLNRYLSLRFGEA